MAFAWKAAGITYNRYLAVAARVVRRSLKDDKRLQAERRGEMDMRFAKWENGKQGENKSLAAANAESMAQHASSSSATAFSQLAISEHVDTPVSSYAVESAQREFRTPASTGFRAVRDVTEEFAAAAAHLRPGQLVKDEYFTLFEAVSALEIMDSKMDSGYVPPGDSLDPEFDPCSPLLAEQILWIMDHLLCLLVVWHDGFPLSQTIFTSLHIDRLISPNNLPPYTLEYGRLPNLKLPHDGHLVHTVLRAYCVAVVKSCEVVLHVIQSQNFYEEEDFVTHLFGRELLPKVSANDAIMAVEDAVTWLVSHSKMDAKLRGALEARLRFMIAYVALLLNDLTNWNVLIELLDLVGATHALALPVLEAFSEKVQRQLATSTPPRHMVHISWDDAVRKWRKMCGDLAEADGLTTPQVCQSAYGLQLATWAFSYREPQPGTFARAYMQSILFSSDKIAEDMTLFDLMLVDIRDLVLAGDALADPESFQVELPSDPRHRRARVMEAFMDRAFDEYVNLYRMVCQNRCRIRRSFTQAVAIWENLEMEAMNAAAELNTISPSVNGGAGPFHPLTAWTNFYKLRIAIWIIQLGVETDIYMPDELCMMMWVLEHYARRLCELVEQMEGALASRMRTLTRDRNTRYLSDCLGSQDFLRGLHLQADVTRLLARSCQRLAGLLLSAHAVKAPKRGYASEELLYEVRMKPLLRLKNDPVPTLGEYKRARAVSETMQATCDQVSADVKAARAAIGVLKTRTREQAKYVGTEEQWRREMKQLETTCVAISVQCSQLVRIAEKHGETRLENLVHVSMPTPAARYHRWWAVPQLTLASTK